MENLPAVTKWAAALAEAAVVEHLWALYDPPALGGLSFPVLTIEHLRTLEKDHGRRLFIRPGCELSTLVMLATLVIVACRLASPT